MRLVRKKHGFHDFYETRADKEVSFYLFGILYLHQNHSTIFIFCATARNPVTEL